MKRSSLLRLSVLPLLCGCLNGQLSSRPPLPAPPPPPRLGAAEAQGEGGRPDRMEGEVAVIDATLNDLRVRMSMTRTGGAELSEALAALDRRAQELKARILATRPGAGADGERARWEVHAAVMDFRVDALHLGDQLAR